VAHLDLLWSSARELADLVRDGRVSSVEVVEAQLRRIEQVNPALNAVVILDGDAALNNARRLDDARQRGDLLGELHGVPLTLKDCHETVGLPTTAGDPRWSTHLPPADSVVVAKLRAAGAVIVGKTNVPPLLGDVQSNNPIFGRTNNPWNLDRTPGGSSGGAAAALAAGLTPLEIGSDIGGSIRIPAHCCGTFGFKPTEGRVSNHGHLPGQFGSFRDAWYMNTIGPLARNVDDLVLAFSVIAGPAAADPRPFPSPVGPVPDVALPGLRLAWCPTYPEVPVADDIRRAIERLVTALGQAGVQIDQSLPLDLDWAEQTNVRSTLREAIRRPTPATELAPILAERTRFQHTWDTFFDRWDGLLAPVMMTTAFPHCDYGTPIAFNGAEHDYNLCTAHCRPFNLTGHPVVVLPIGQDRDGLPIGVQLVGARWRDERLLGIARALAEVSGSFTRPGEL